jgi:lipoyl(octanoyl) transferase
MERPTPPPAILRSLPGASDYAATLAAMRGFTEARGPLTPDEVWLLEHPPVYTLGLNASEAHVLDPGTVPVIRTDRGGQVTYHGPGQVVAYVLVDLARAGLGVRRMVSALEAAVIVLAGRRGITATARREAPGVYVAGRKLASVGLRVRRGATYHGLALNVDPDLAAFRRINPCGDPELAATSLADLGHPAGLAEVGVELGRQILLELGLAAGPALRGLP